MRAAQIMTKDVVTVRPHTTVAEMARLLVEHRIRAVPVVDDENQVLGIVSESDLILKEKAIPFSAVKLPSLFKEWVDLQGLVQIFAEGRHHTADYVMTREVTTVDIDEEIGGVAWAMAQRDADQVLVLSGGKLAGVITRADLIRTLARRS